ncbi:afadin-like [Convolutriloba macropyga]|uniref:afadin-like n=1 Tax=Convolutriloba macropyga TaxID=536237 RepID=UPI003F525654
MNAITASSLGSAEEYKRLTSQIEEWNKYRLSLFELSLPNENLEFFGVMRFYLFDQKEEVQTKCLRISSSATTQDVIDALVGKFFADLKNLDGNPESYSLYEVLQTGERKLQSDEYPLVVQLNWTEDCREGRFLLKSNNALNIAGNSASSLTGGNAKLEGNSGSKRKKKDGSTSGAVAGGGSSVSMKNSLAAKLFSEKPETSLTKSISDKDAAMQQKRREKVELKMQDFTNANGGPDSGGPLKIYGFRIKPEFNYKSILAGCRDSAVTIVDDALKKFDIATPDPDLYCLVQVVVPNGKKESDYHRGDEQVTGEGRRIGSQGRHSSRWQERFLDDHEVPWQNFTSFPKQKGTLMFCLVERPPDRMRRKSEGGVHRQHPPPPLHQSGPGNRNSQNGMPPINRGGFKGPLSVANKQVPYLIAIPTGDSQNEVSKFDLVSDTVEIGSDPKTRYIGGQFIQLHGPGIRGHHCILSQTDSNSWTVSPSSSSSSSYSGGVSSTAVSSELLVNGHSITETVILPPGAVIQIGHMSQFQFVLPEFLNRARNPSQVNPENSKLTNPSGPSVAPAVDGRSGATYGNVNANSGNGGVSVPAMASPVSVDQIPHIEVGYDTNFNFHVLVDTAETSGISDDELPGAIEFMDEVEQEILHYAVSRFDEVMTMFKVAPSFLFYMCARSVSLLDC